MAMIAAITHETGFNIQSSPTGAAEFDNTQQILVVSEVAGNQVVSFNQQKSLEYYSQEAPLRQAQCAITRDQQNCCVDEALEARNLDGVMGETKDMDSSELLWICNKYVKMHARYAKCALHGWALDLKMGNTDLLLGLVVVNICPALPLYSACFFQPVFELQHILDIPILTMYGKLMGMQYLYHASTMARHLLTSGIESGTLLGYTA
ncbi:uncharacterized protein BJ212DRAFT_1551547 [Suillus subaureus]|uniref:Uncharacterized protein n=1 Tax=Suillus subaureus TaxID=48587 RepID=A0A9P7DT47_9AGAM|nr:uncharacterized protein BJ212DRAFT_1551547 [Suillus subaureus]KAG1802554.1 hypothetical protein BJ212DRAFT_1551547 [Suillus subaureus]